MRAVLVLLLSLASLTAAAQEDASPRGDEADEEGTGDADRQSDSDESLEAGEPSEGSPAEAAEDVPPPPEESETVVDPLSDEGELRYQTGQRAFAAGRFREAIRDYRRAYELIGRAEILIDIADAADRIRDDRAALQALELYLERAAPDAPRREEIEARAEVLRGVVGEDGDEEDEQPGPLDGRRVFWVVGALSLVAVGVSVGSWIGANDAYDELFTRCEAAGGCTDDIVERSSVNTRVTLTNVFLGLSLGLAAATVGLYFLEAPDPDDEEDDVEVDAGPTGVVVRGVF